MENRGTDLSKARSDPKTRKMLDETMEKIKSGEISREEATNIINGLENDTCRQKPKNV